MLIIVKPKEYICGIFSKIDDIFNYMAGIPEGNFELLSLSLTFPFYIGECHHTTRQFFYFQDKDEAEEFDYDILYTITEDFIPSIPWNDEMGNLPHHHRDNEDT